MTQRNPIAGGFLLIAAILIGFVWGVAIGQPVNGVLVGTAVGIFAALAVWLIDRRKERR